MAQQESDEQVRKWVEEYGASGNPPKSYTKTRHLGTTEEAKARDAAIIDGALDRADSGRPTPDSMLRRK